ncbi:LLM class F420-dependent oxidoreductase [Actinomadura sp. NBRC 104412]|uniref:LLM class F420-dependent oxidoreductase n=1 Tax=Actinomadura sp. NBRC 104412 TaxID=3032203 RepID=UPI0024A18A12|nr:LLM class F420-dependent oxidoreductase [Actinomadura sp. NBRC 104412]GLZ08153.1 LLM class F420-dependent oxidoreductase [Actinomadura sp. NBRC 104412]
MRWGITVPLRGIALGAQRAVVERLADLGYTDAWSGEASGHDAFTPLAIISQWAPGLRLGTAIAPIYTRGPGLLAMQAGTLANLAPGRFVMGIGASSRTIVEDWNAGSMAAPLASTRDMVRFLRKALRGERVNEEYTTFAIRGFRLDTPPETPPPLAVAALRPRMLRLAAEESEGAITNWVSAPDVVQVRASAGPEVELLARVYVVPTEDADMARALARRQVAAYLTVPGYAAFQEWLGRGPRLAAMGERWAAGDRRGALEAIDDEVVDELVLWGSLKEIRDRVDEYRSNGVDTPIITILPPGPADEATWVSWLAGLAPPR